MERLLDLEMPRTRRCGVAARRAVEAETSGRLPPQVLDDLKLLVTELVENAYLHGRGRIWLKLELHDRALRVEVVDEGEDAAVHVRPTPSLHGGYGLRIVDQVAQTWGTYEGTTHVWADIALPGA
jgi:anti-sigma regulatory factor (Ser/Thr protein kinase)